MRLCAISDLHVGDRVNRDAIAALPAQKDDWLILGGDVGETVEHLAWTFEALKPKFKKLLWVPGNHELWTTPKAPELRGDTKYRRLVEVCRAFDVASPEDPYPVFESEAEGPIVVAPLFLLYDYSFRPDHITRENALSWAEEHDTVCVDEVLLHPDPYPTREAWCEARCAFSEARLSEIDPSLPTVLVNHFPMRQEHAILPRIPRFTLWCGTRRTHDYHQRFRARVVVTGHLHIRTTRHLDGVRFEEVSLGYSRQWAQERGVAGYLRTIL
jgi:3',5'-cyclic AMP phosphodiesterase CpdA